MNRRVQVARFGTRVVADMSGVAGAGLLALLCLVSGPAIAQDRIPMGVLKGDRDACVRNASQNKALSADQVNAYCECVVDEIAGGFTVEEYSAMALAIQNGQSHPGQHKLGRFVAACMKRTLQ